jgi:two-component system cell cycle response regulator DivK
MRRPILVVEDNEINLQLVRDLLEYAGFEVAEAGSVDEGRSKLREARPALVLMDIQIPGGGGESLLREIRADRALAHTPVVAVTAYAMHGDRDKYLAAGFDGYLSKPIDTRTFVESVRAFLPGEERVDGK